MFVADEQNDVPVDIAALEHARRGRARTTKGCGATPSCRCSSSTRRRSPSSTSGSWSTTGPTDVLAFPIDDDGRSRPSPDRRPSGPTAPRPTRRAAAPARRRRHLPGGRRPQRARRTRHIRRRARAARRARHPPRARPRPRRGRRGSRDASPRARAARGTPWRRPGARRLPTGAVVTLAVEFGTGDLAMVAGRRGADLVAGYVAVAETALTRMNKAKAMTLAEERPRRGRALLRLVEPPRAVPQPAAARAPGVPARPGHARRRRWPSGCSARSASPSRPSSTWWSSSCSPRRRRRPGRSSTPSGPRCSSARPVAALVGFPPLRLVSPRAHRAHERDPPRQGPEEGAVRLRGGAARRCRRGGRGRRDRGEERELIESIIEFGDTVVREVMVPRPDMVTVPESESAT